MDRFFFSGWTPLLRVLLVGVCAYAALLVVLRISGKRTLSKMNAFDLVVTVALGSTLATVLLSKDVALAEGLVALALLVSLQYLVAWASVRSTVAGRWLKSEPAVLFHRGRFLCDALRRERVTQGEVLAAIRQQGLASLDDVEAVVLETDGSFSALRRAGDAEATALRGTGFGPERQGKRVHDECPS